MTQKELNDLKKWGEIELAIKDTKRGITVHSPRGLRNIAEKLEKTNFDLEELMSLQHLLGTYVNSLQRDIIDLLQLEKFSKELED
jgi:hypothetical protein